MMRKPLLSPVGEFLQKSKGMGSDGQGATRVSSFMVPRSLSDAMKWLWLQYNKAGGVDWRGVESNCTLKAHSLGQDTDMRLGKMKRFFAKKPGTSHILALVEELEQRLTMYISTVANTINAWPVSGCTGDNLMNQWELSFLCTFKADSKQAPHVDYDPSVYQRSEWEKKTRDRKLTHQQSVPYVLEFPLYSEGMEVEIWPWEEDICAPIAEDRRVTSRRIGLDLGQSIIFRGDVVHAGGSREEGMGTYECTFTYTREGFHQGETIFPFP